MNSLAPDLKQPAIHLICGSTGAGKSTYAEHLRSQIDAAYFSIDDWMTTLFDPDITTPMDWHWISERASRCETQILSQAVALSQSGTSSILEIGLQTKEKRQKIFSDLDNANCELHTHYLQVGPQERWGRVQKRNREMGATYRLTITKDIFDFFEQLWEPISEEEYSLLNVREARIK